MAKCFQLIAKLEATYTYAVVAASVAYHIRPHEPPDWHSEPLPRPPQA
jgi:hypothetical protein